jgi:catechol 2,3-dioxygenase-like lactoylglutathione lyase family enzyme
MKIIFFIGIVQLFIVSSITKAFSQIADLKLYAAKIVVPDIQKAKDFYCDVLKFQIDSNAQNGKVIILKTNSYKIILAEDKKVIPLSKIGYGQISITIQVNNLDSTIAYLKSKNVVFVSDKKRPEGIGFSCQALDPFNNYLSFDEVTSSKKRITEPWLYNCGISVVDIDKSLVFYKDKLNFLELTRHYMPDDMPLGYQDKSFGFMLHKKREDLPFVKNPNMFLVFSVESKAKMKEFQKLVKLKKQKKSYFMEDVDGNFSEVIFLK